jgi:hypothetical protein
MQMFITQTHLKFINWSESDLWEKSRRVLWWMWHDINTRCSQVQMRVHLSSKPHSEHSKHYLSRVTSKVSRNIKLKFNYLNIFQITRNSKFLKNYPKSYNITKFLNLQNVPKMWKRRRTRSSVTHKITYSNLTSLNVSSVVTQYAAGWAVTWWAVSNFTWSDTCQNRFHLMSLPEI